MSWFCGKCNSENIDELNECLDCKKNNQPYYKKSLSSDSKARDQFTVELNAEERRQLELLKTRWDFKSDSKVLKLCLENAINNQNINWSEETWRYVLSVNRQRLSNFKKLPETTPKENARQF